MQYAGIGLDVLRRLPSPRIARVNLATTYRCTHRCVMCNIWQHNQDQKQELEVTADEVDKLCHYNHLMWVSLTGGEPFLNHQIGDIIRACANSCRMVSITTNGWLTDRIIESVKFGLAGTKAIIMVSVSLHGDRDGHDKTVGLLGAYYHAVETLTRLKLIDNPRLKVGIEYLLSSRNNGEHKTIELLADDLGIGLTYASEQSASYYGHTNGHSQMEVPRTLFSINPIDLFRHVYVKGLRNKKKCVALDYSCFISPYLDVYPCLFFTPTMPLKNLRAFNYKIGTIEKPDGVKNCSGCWTPCETYATMLFRPWRLL